ncbi:MAG TPA: hypothetical protein VJA21_32485 [Verrucomicrobiae bacterium]
MKPVCLVVLLVALAVAGVVYGETFIGPTTTSNRLLVPTNSAIIITTTLGDFTNSTQVQLYNSAPFTQSYFAPLENGNVYALAGPAELIFSNVVLFTFYRLTNSGIYSQGIANDPIGIPIASNKTMHIFGVPGAVNASFTRQSPDGGGTLNFALEPNRPAEFTGPGTLYSNSGVFPPYAKFISYFVEEDGFTLPDQRAIAGPSGSFAVIVEKSVDLTNWAPVLMKNTSNPAPAFYRLRIQR